MKPTRNLFASLLSLSVITLAGSHSAQAATRTWDGSTSGDWNEPTNWSGNSLPSANNDNASFAGAFGIGGTAITLGANQNTETLPISTATDFSLNDFTLTLASGDITRSATTSANALGLGTLNVATGSATEHPIRTKVALGANQTWSVTDIAQVLNATNEISGGFALTKAGNGNLTFTAANTYTGDTIIKAGTLELNGIASVLSTKIIVGDTGSNGAVLDVSGTTSNFEVTASQTLSGIGTINGGASTIQVNGTIAPGDVDRGNLASAGSINFANGSYTLVSQQLLVSYFGDSVNNSFTGGNDFVMVTVPEPSAALLGGLGALFLLRRRRNA